MMHVFILFRDMSQFYDQRKWFMGFYKWFFFNEISYIQWEISEFCLSREIVTRGIRVMSWYWYDNILLLEIYLNYLSLIFTCLLIRCVDDVPLIFECKTLGNCLVWNAFVYCRDYWHFHQIRSFLYKFVKILILQCPGGISLLYYTLHWNMEIRIQ